MKKLVFLLALGVVPLQGKDWQYIFKNETKSPVELSVDFSKNGKTCPTYHFYLARQGSEFEDMREKPVKKYLSEFAFTADCSIDKITAKRLMTDEGRPIDAPPVVYRAPDNASLTITVLPAKTDFPHKPRSGYEIYKPDGHNAITIKSEKIFEHKPSHRSFSSIFKANKGD